MSGAGGGTVRGILGRDPVHPFPARMAPEIALDVISGCRESLRVLDPMCGSGTVLAVARSRGHSAVGVDLDPLAVLTSKVWTTTVDAELLREQAATALIRARHIFGSMRTRDLYPPNADAETQRFVRYWFDPYARRQLSALALAIQEVQNDETRNALLCAFSRLIITKQSGASLAMDLSHSRPHRAFARAPVKPFSKFLFAVDRVAKGCVDGNVRSPGPAAYVHHGDARSLALADDSIDLVLTSPPYLNAIDYFRCSKFSLIWMGYSIRELRQARAGARGRRRHGGRQGCGQRPGTPMDSRYVGTEAKASSEAGGNAGAVHRRHAGSRWRSCSSACRRWKGCVRSRREHAARHVHPKLTDGGTSREPGGTLAHGPAFQGTPAEPAVPPAALDPIETCGTERSHASRGDIDVREGGVSPIRRAPVPG